NMLNGYGKLDAELAIAERRTEALSRTGGMKVKPLDEDDYEEIISAAAINMRKATSGIRGQMITVQDCLDWWVMKETEHRILSALSPAPEAQQEPPQAAAQADYERIILSALEPAPESQEEPVAEAL